MRNSDTDEPYGRGGNCLTGSPIVSYLLELVVLAGVSGLIAWICTLIHARWPFVFPLLSDFVFICALGVVALLTVHLTSLLRAHAHLLEGLGNLAAALSVLSDRSKIERVVEQVRSSINKESNIAGITGLIITQDLPLPVLRSGTQIENACLMLESRLLHRITQAAVYLLALALPWTLWYQFRWFTILVVPVAMTPILLLRQYGAKLRGRNRAAARDSHEWSNLDLRLDQMRLLAAK